MSFVILSHVKMHEKTARVWFGVISVLEVGNLLRSLYMNGCILFIVPMGWQIVWVQSKPIAIIFVEKNNKPAQGIHAVSEQEAKKDP